MNSNWQGTLISEPLNEALFEWQLAGHPDQDAVSNVINGICHSFLLGFYTHRLKLEKRNKSPAIQHPSLIDAYMYLDNEVALCQVAGLYNKVDHTIPMISKFGPGALMAKFDVEAAYRNTPMHADDHFLLGLKWLQSLPLLLVINELPLGLPHAFNILHCFIVLGLGPLLLQSCVYPVKVLFL